MRANEIIRSILDLIDGLDGGEKQPTLQIAIGSTPIATDAVTAIDNSADEFDSDDVRRFKQIVDLANNDGSDTVFSNAPNEQVADIDAVTVDAGGGWQAPKHPSDIRGEHPSMYPGHQHKVGK